VAKRHTTALVDLVAPDAIAGDVDLGPLRTSLLPALNALSGVRLLIARWGRISL